MARATVSNPVSNPAEIVKRLLAEPELPPLIGVLSPDEIRRERIVNLFMEKQLGPAAAPAGVTPIPQPGKEKTSRGSFDYRRLDGRTLSEKDLRLLRDEINSLSLFSSRRLFVVRHIDAVSADFQKILIEICSKPVPETVMILSGTKLLEASVLKKHLKSRAVLIELEEIKGPELPRWVEKELKRAGFKSWEQRAAAAITEIGEASPDSIVRDIEHVKLYCEGDAFRMEDIERVFTQRAMAGEFAVIDEIVHGRRVQAEANLVRILRSGKNPFMFLGLLAKTFCGYLAVKSLLESGKPPARAAQELDMPPWLVSKHAAAAAKYSVEKLGRCLRAILRADSKLKNRSLGHEAIFSELLDDLGA